MKKLLFVLGTLLGSIIIIAVNFGLSSLIFWGLGALIIWVFKIKYTWTIWHGLVCALVFVLLKEIFGK